MYEGIFKSWKDVQEEYKTDYPEPDKVYYASYTNEDYSGDSWVVYRNNGKYYTVDGGHCSCYGLEGQFDPEEYETKELLLACLEKNNEVYSMVGVNKAFVINQLKEDTQL